MSDPVVIQSVTDTNAADAVLRCQGLGMTYAEGKLRTPVFDGLDLSVRKGETVAILGASGAGKSTLLHLLGGLDAPTAGSVTRNVLPQPGPALSPPKFDGSIPT